MLIKGKKEQLEEVDGDPYKYFLLAGRKSIAVSVLYRYKPFLILGIQTTEVRNFIDHSF